MLTVMFTVTFFNTAILALIETMNFSEVAKDLSELFSSDNRGETDFSQEWYYGVGASLVINMVLEIVIPFLSELFDCLLSRCLRCCDRGCSRNEGKTRTTSIKEYIELYSGPRYTLYSRSSDLLLYVAIAYMYGTAMPLMYLLALLAIVRLYIFDKILLCWQYKRPPMYNFAITKATTDALSYLTVCCLPFVFW
jgi:hypothetical protein